MEQFIQDKSKHIVISLVFLVNISLFFALKYGLDHSLIPVEQVALSKNSIIDYPLSLILSNFMHAGYIHMFF